MNELTRTLRERGLSVVSSTENVPGMEGGVLIRHAYDSTRVKEMAGAGYRTVPSGRKHTIVFPSREFGGGAE